MRNKLSAYAIVGLLAVLLSMNLRYLPFSDRSDIHLKKIAKTYVHQKVKEKLEKLLVKSLPDMPGHIRKNVLEKKFKDVLVKNRSDINKSIKKNYEALKQAKKKATKPYLIAADSYYYLGLTKNILESGNVSDSIKGGLYYNPLMMAPYGHRFYFDLHPYVGFVVYKASLFFNRGLGLVRGVSFTPLVLTILAILVFLMFSYSQGISPVPALIGTIFFVSAPIFLQRSLYGWYDTDSYNIIFPLLLLCTIFHSVSLEKTYKYRLISCITASVFTGIYTMFWSGWTFILICMSCFFALIILYNSITENRSRAKEYVFLFIIYSIATLACIFLLRGVDGLVFSISDTIGRLSKFRESDFNLWPDAFLMVGELKKISLKKIAVLSGGRIFSIISLAGLGILFLSKKDFFGSKASNTHKGLCLVSFLFISFIMAKNAERFTILLVTPLSISFVLLINLIYAKIFKIREIKLRYAAVAGLLATLVIPISSSRLITLRKQPVIYNATWDKAMNYIREHTPKDSIVNTWWAPGHFITSIGRRRVTYDGATLEKPVGYWISRAFLAQDEREAAGILRMLNTSGNTATTFLEEQGFPLSKAIGIINKTLLLSRRESGGVVRKYLDNTKTEAFLDLMYGTPPTSYLMLYRDLTEKAIALQFMGNWDFKKAETFKSLKKKNPGKANNIMKRAGNYVSFLWAISGGRLYYEKISPGKKRVDKSVYFSNGLILDLDRKTISFTPEEHKFKNRIKSLIYTENRNLREKFYTDTGNLSVILLEEAGRYSVIIADRRMATSVIFRLYYLKGVGLNRFKLAVHANEDPDNTDIYLYEVIW